jgi:Cft2 family RNA processing exonuclease
MGGLDILLDSGLHPKKEGVEALPEFSLLSKAPDAAIITHSHIDHCGSLPHLLKMFPTVAPYATAPTLRIMDRMLHNSVSVMGILKKERHIHDYPLYQHSDVEYAVKKTYAIEMGQEFAFSPDSELRATFSPAGHVLGSSSVRLNAGGRSVFYTADICAVDQELMPAFQYPDDPESIDTLIIESTYGANETADAVSYSDEIERFGAAMAAVLANNGSVLVPSFALGRAQEILNIVARLQDEGVLPDVPVYASGLGRAVYEIYARFRDQLKPGADLSPLSKFEKVGDVWNPEVARKLLREPCIIVATSGMMIQNTPSAAIAQEMVKDPRHGILFVGYCDPDTLGHQVKTCSPGDSLDFILGAGPTEIQLDNIQSFHFSAHAPRKALQRVIERIKPDHVIFVHGDPEAMDWMYENTPNGASKYMPSIGETLSL